MKKYTTKTIIEGGILFTLVFLGSVLIAKVQGVIDSLDDINDSLKTLNKTVGGGTDPKKDPPNT